MHTLTFFNLKAAKALAGVLMVQTSKVRDGRMVELMEAQDKNGLRLTDEQLAEVRRRRANKNAKYVSLAEARKRFRSLGYEGHFR